MNTWSTLPENYLQRVYNTTLATVKRHTQQEENPMPADVLSVEAVRDNNAILHDYVTSEVALDIPEIGSTVPKIPIDSNCTDDTLHFGTPGACSNFEDEGEDGDAIPTAHRQGQALTDLGRIHLGTSDVDGYEDEVDDDADANEEEEESQANDGSTQNVED
jgi:hypothetical protein